MTEQIIEKPSILMDFSGAMHAAVFGKSVRRLDWQPGFYMFFKDTRLKIFEPLKAETGEANVYSDCVIVEDDVIAEDWVTTD